MVRREKKQATVVDEGGAYYRDIADVMTWMGYPMNHNTARNDVQRVMRKFVIAYLDRLGKACTEDDVLAMAQNRLFQQGISDVLHVVEELRRRNK